MLRFGLQTLVQRCPSLRLVGCTGTLAEGCALITELSPDLVMTDLTLRDSSGLETVRMVVNRQHPRPTLVISAQDELLYGEQVLALGAAGYIMTDNAQAEAVAASLALLDGQRWISPALSALLVSRLLQRRRHVTSPAPTGLTGRELEVLEHLKTGKSTKQIAAALSISVRTVDLYRTRIKKKLGLRTGAELIAYASQHL